MTDKEPLDDANNREPPPGEDADAEQATDELLRETIDFGAAAAQAATAEPNEVESLKLRLAESENHALRTQAELDNFRKRVYRDIEVERRYAEETLLRDLLVVVDNMERAIQAASGDGSAENGSILEGMRIVQKQFLSVLESHHCQLIEARNGPFDPNYHEAIGQMPHAEVPEGHVIDIAVEGYVLHDRVLRPTQVLVSSGPA